MVKTTTGANRLKVIAALCALSLGSTLLSAEGNSITDLAGRRVSLPATVARISAIHPIPSHMLWRLAPLKLASIDSQFKDRMLFMPQAEKDRLLALPVTGQFHSKDLSREQLLHIKPDVIISLSKDLAIEQEQRDFETPIIAASKDDLLGYAASWRLVGKVVGNEKEGDELADYWETSLKRITAISDKIPTASRLKVYYAQPGLTTTVGSASIMNSLIREAGGLGFFDQHPIDKTQTENEAIVVSMEDIAAWNPDVIIAKTASARDEILKNSQWKSLKAVRDKRVYATLKYAMMDRIQALMGLYWCAETLYPKKYDYDLAALMREFYKKVYLSDAISAEEMREELR
jgi:iron complex transport system substrate-binding protein